MSKYGGVDSFIMACLDFNYIFLKVSEIRELARQCDIREPNGFKISEAAKDILRVAEAYRIYGRN